MGAALLAAGGQGAAGAATIAPPEPLGPLSDGTVRPVGVDPDFGLGKAFFTDQDSFDAVLACLDDEAADVTLVVDGAATESFAAFPDPSDFVALYEEAVDPEGYGLPEIPAFGASADGDVVGGFTVIWGPSEATSVVFTCSHDGGSYDVEFQFWGDVDTGEGIFPFWYAIGLASPNTPKPVAGGIAISCLPEPVAPGGRVECYLAGPDAGDSIDWQASYNPTFASGTVVTDAGGFASFSFLAPAVASGTVLTVSLPDDGRSTTVTVSGGPVPTRIPAGAGGSTPMTSTAAVGLAMAALLVATERRRRARPTA
jgi:hypothetical protein